MKYVHDVILIITVYHILCYPDPTSSPLGPNRLSHPTRAHSLAEEAQV